MRLDRRLLGWGLGPILRGTTKDHIELCMSANAGRFGLHMGGSCGA